MIAHTEEKTSVETRELILPKAFRKRFPEWSRQSLRYQMGECRIKPKYPQLRIKIVTGKKFIELINGDPFIKYLTK